MSPLNPLSGPVSTELSNEPVHHFCTHAWSNIIITHLFTRYEKVCYDLTVLNYRYTKLFQKKIQIQDRDKFHYPFLKQFLSISFLLLNTSKNQKLLVVRLLERCHNNSTFTLRLLQRLEGNLMMLRKSQEL